MRWDAAGFAGNPIVQTPHLDRLAQDGVCFENAYCPSPVCSPARASWLTGLYPHAHLQLRNYGPGRKGEWGCYLPNDCVTIGDVLQRAGYRCGIVGPWHLGDDHRPQHGFEDFWCTYRYLGPDYPDPLFDYFEREGVPNLYSRDAEGVTQYGNTMEFATLTDPRQQRTTWTIDRSIEFLQRRSEEPFFLFASIKDPHPRILIPPELLERYPEDQIPISRSFPDPLHGKPKYQERAKFRIPDTVTEEQLRRMIAYYYALITHIDDQTGRLLRTLRDQGAIDNTIVAFISDHGEMLGDHGFTEKCFMYEPSVRVPCLISWPEKLPRETRMSTPFAGVDLMPTLLDLVGASPPEPIDGRSIADALLDGTEPDAQPIFAEIASLDAIYHNAQDAEQLAAHVMNFDGRWKYIRNRFDIDELYDLKTDPGEMHNIAHQPEQGERIASMRRQIAEMVCHTGPGPYEWCLSDEPVAQSQ
jgi:arylsulfatase A-like enzyme